MGAFNCPEFSLVHFPLQPGDCFYFLSDGISDKLPDSATSHLEDFSITTTMLAETTNLKIIRDDCSAVCIKLKDQYDSLQYFFSGMDEVVTMYKHNRRVLQEIAGSQALYLEIALNEAINNILIHGSGCGCVKIKRTKRGRVILRIKDSKQGFNAQATLELFRSKTAEEIAEMVSTMESYRGILIMKLYTDKFFYNKNGTEVMLVRNITPDIRCRLT
jgi:anti-sigma regulatory factor (Ser/Thr protein kinase)